MRQCTAHPRVAAAACLAATLAACGADPVTPRAAAAGAARAEAAPVPSPPVAPATSTPTSVFAAPAVTGARAAHADEAVPPPPPRETPAAPRVGLAADVERRYRVQLGAYMRGSTAASLAWEGMVARHAALAGRMPLIGAARMPDGTSIHRLQVAGLTRAEAQDLCAALVATGDACFVVAPPHAPPRRGTRGRADARPRAMPGVVGN
jgi:hypothetical protein